MKKILTTILVLCLIGFGVRAQQPEDNDPPQVDPKTMEKINNLRIAYLSEKLKLSSEQAEKFWPVYNEFAAQRRAANEEIRIARKEIDPKNPDPKKQQALIDVSLRVKQRVLDLEKDYSSRLMRVITAEQLINLRRAEIDFREMLQQRRIIQQRRENFRERNQQLQQRN